MPTVEKPHLNIKLISGSSNVEITVTTKVTLDTTDMFLVKNAGLRFKLKGKMRGEDSGFNGGDDDLFNLPSLGVMETATITTKKTVSRDSLDEDWEGNDEVYARMTLVSLSPIFPFSKSRDSATITGNF